MTKVSFVIVDDAIFMRTLLRKLIEEIDGYTVVAEASNGKEAIEAAQKYQPDIMTLDITMPEMDGIMALPKIVEVSPKTRVIVVSAMGQQSIVIDAIKMGAKDFIVKPFEKYKVYQTIQNVLAL
ncbi:chemotaxis protein CheY [Thermoclostridium stercorarium subsp. stercorarium DSM 8532]|jgi:two-component system chemotaxis response regulator CheY|uniref:Stage 0 sporulation protein A homolog n=3 Tax=Thermoclostridium stercorarium TaxID=1510 RepID=L7VQP5_THES1|nr:response regulator [Thermoclostridium stercorarium]AGC68999.1 chemotaxis protein CheY [Thermoclostridium stercorarium subsp. stercorarium DSM 8532]AGI39978.1 response regulator [Thermoclostridium stercorarium subsp. stercorarium DSM 8532]ANW99298.1 two-component system response regulator [Thermoclostridium stercorarium subsp. thermolacticum DSM 2910]ANX01927.1 two-component system response regulator [Thermoclostridium stercorarium subsp. leptospartum DSM 9219]UZQ84969.1 response regulator [